ncbi:SDR family NAD(P)-dependent oxidoreductase [Erwinia psidii]|uniref:SDR family oxidoreductase n=1 Tax=Erwinia psidii TaxID=69224 RepID=A0A3N6UXH0_9GAMM|nr:SDR family oxidoreductase [Erwinia psidii]MCX8957086.1 SDR family oxidoreductase [Erwinia psidii]MCX8961738.1 SDR family oxidoreductase [Erwinia psidii]MCX8965332.1 SDR family oxidoreductase [Erwinia psidii]RQM37535.1 SDR family oxidoreductase [Erwinia psidii]
MKIDLSGKTAIVTGSTKGIGKGIAQGLDAAGAAVVITGRSEEQVSSLVKSLGPQARGHVVDLSTAEGCKTLLNAEPSCDILINNAGIFPGGDFFATGDEVWQNIWDINVMSAVRLSRAYLPQMIKSQWGRVVFLSSESAVNIPADMIHYGVSKTALLALSRGLAKAAAGTGVTVNAVLPGPTLSDGFAAFFEEQLAQGADLNELGVEFVKENRPTSLIQRAASVEEVSNMVVYVSSPLSSATTGAALRVDGGVVETPF